MRREFPQSVKLAAWQRSKGHCDSCGIKIVAGNGPNYDHRIADGLGGEPTMENCDVLCRNCHGAKTAERDVPAIAKAKRIEKRAAGAERRRSRPIPGSKASGLRKKMDGTVERR